MIKIGMALADRYEIEEKIGTGGMSDVYRARDLKLNRLVAVKILKQEFSENQNFVSKFRTEAQAAAGLMHPNIVNVYDVGDENGINYIVMELVDGITLKKYIEKKNRLSVREAVSIAIQVAMGLQAAHDHHIIHRDIKPQNILISREGKVKVADFGIAKAATSNTITSNVMGSVHYTSPEQARGGYSDAKSDIYSLGVTLFEMVTGRVPFNGETTVAIAIKHIQEALPSPKEYAPDLPISVEKIILKCCEKSPDRRYQSAEDLIRDLKRSLITPDEDFVTMIRPEEENATRVSTQQEQIRQSHTVPSGEMRLNEEPVRTGKSGSGNRTDKSGRDRDRSREKSRSRDNDRSSSDAGLERLTIIMAVIAAFLIGIILLFLIGRSFGLFGSENGKPTSSSGISATEISTASEAVSQDGIVVPQVVGLSFAEARSQLEAKGFVVEKAEDADNIRPKNEVTAQKPGADWRASSGATVTLTVSTGANAAEAAGTAATADPMAAASDSAATAVSMEQEVAVPNVIGLDEETATATLIEAGLTVGSVTSVNHEDPSLNGLICNQAPVFSTKVAAGSAVNLELSIGPANILYSYEADIPAPTAEEDASYSGGTPVTLSMTTEDGTPLLNTTTTVFPYHVGFHGITSARGILTMNFTATTQSYVDESGNTIEGTTEERTVTRVINFTQE